VNAAIADRAAFIRANTEVMAPPLVPEIALHLAHEALPLWLKTEEQLETEGLPPPFWAFAWAGGQALARYVLDHRESVRGRRIVDLASGSGIVAIAAMKADAAFALAADVDLFAVAATGMNAALNGVSLETTAADLLATEAPSDATILVGDFFYQRSLADAALAWLTQAAGRGADILIGDPGRSYLPKDLLVPVAEYGVPVSRELEDSETKRTKVWRFAP
jgi:predicted nicotinamide N-methyase